MDRYSILTEKKKEDAFLTVKNKLTASTNIYSLTKSYTCKDIPVEFKKIIALETSRKRHRFSHYFYVVGGYNFNKKSNCSCWRVDCDKFVRHVQRNLSDHSKNKVSNLISAPNKIFQRSKPSSLFEKLPCFPNKDIEDYRIVKIATCIYVTGGVYYDTLEAVDTTWIYDTRLNCWKKGANMKQKR